MVESAKPLNPNNPDGTGVTTILWLMSISSYSNLRLIKGCEHFGDLSPTKRLEEIHKMRKMIFYDHLFNDENPNKDKV